MITQITSFVIDYTETVDKPVKKRIFLTQPTSFGNQCHLAGFDGIYLSGYIYIG